MYKCLYLYIYQHWYGTKNIFFLLTVKFIKYHLHTALVCTPVGNAD